MCLDHVQRAHHKLVVFLEYIPHKHNIRSIPKITIPNSFSVLLTWTPIPPKHTNDKSTDIIIV